ncbi:hypothetical protein EJB05_28791, partial [Eragrostis curvula]
MCFDLGRTRGFFLLCTAAWHISATCAAAGDRTPVDRANAPEPSGSDQSGCPRVGAFFVLDSTSMPDACGTPLLHCTRHAPSLASAFQPVVEAAR